MLPTAHLAAGLVIGRLTGNYPAALLGSVLIDLDHLIPFAKQGILFDPRGFFKVIFGSRHFTGQPRNYFHSFIAWLIFSFVAVWISGIAGLVLSLAYFVHLFFDLIDGSNFYPFYPFKGLNVKLPLKTFWKPEMIFTVLLLLVFFATFVLDFDRVAAEDFHASPNTTTVCFSEACIDAEIADTADQRTQGLMFRKELAEDRGMLFVYETEGLYSFWMKNTHIPLDIIWIDTNSQWDFRVTHIEHAVPCLDNENCPLYGPGPLAQYILEANAGFVDKNEVQVGDIVNIEIFNTRAF